MPKVSFKQMVWAVFIGGILALLLFVEWSQQPITYTNVGDPTGSTITLQRINPEKLEDLTHILTVIATKDTSVLVSPYIGDYFCDGSIQSIVEIEEPRMYQLDVDELCWCITILEDSK